MSLGSDPIFQKIIEGLKGNEAKAKAVNGVFLYKITKDGKVAKEWSKYHSGQKNNNAKRNHSTQIRTHTLHQLWGTKGVFISTINTKYLETSFSMTFIWLTLSQ